MSRDHAAKSSDTTRLEIGWVVNKQLKPRYWLRPGAKIGGHSSKDDLVTLDSTVMGRHAIVVAQSGSGKSFFLGRLIEELLLKTRSRILILDPNADFRRISDGAPTKYWSEAGYEKTKKHEGYLPTESRDDFLDKWADVSKLVHLCGIEDHDADNSIQIDWLDLSIDWLFGDPEAILRTELEHCHAFVKIISGILKDDHPRARRARIQDINLIKKLYDKGAGKTRAVIEKAIYKELKSKVRRIVANQKGNTKAAQRAKKSLFENRYQRDISIQRAAIHLSFVSKETARYYLSVAYEKRESDLINLALTQPSAFPEKRVQVLDLQSIGNSADVMMTVSVFIDREMRAARARWEKALNLKDSEKDKRSPTFLVVDEAHNLIFATPSNAAQGRLREQFRTLAAEGRKFGLFLILVTQRPDKIDPMVVSEIENRAVMKLGSDFVLRRTCKLLGFDGPTAVTAKRCTGFHKGRALLVGPWADPKNPYLYVAVRRTAEGGKDLDEKYWATLPEPE